MLRAIISDIHSNVEALDAVLADVARRKVESIVCLGDVIGYGPQPRETLKRSTEWEITLLGNHEEACMFHPEDFNERARIALEWTRDQLNSKSASPDDNFKLWSLIGAMPTQHKIDNALLVHGSPRDPVHEYIMKTDVIFVPDKIRDIFTQVEKLCFVGHTHFPGVFTADLRFRDPSQFDYVFEWKGERAIVNVGSVGQPRDGDPRACCVIVEDNTIRFLRTDYDVATVQRKIYDNPNIPDLCAARLEIGK